MGRWHQPSAGLVTAAAGHNTHDAGKPALQLEPAGPGQPAAPLSAAAGSGKHDDDDGGVDDDVAEVLGGAAAPCRWMVWSLQLLAVRWQH